eukprot:TRINITY_DN29829_c0_g1_i1.p1 TRINITY_DN29829_c0_g1~~TRINITY_DN29829_c0_g1_i1.p1  ORF type:complete len:296 (-),score=85.67 TRINITY_DN29829_c0_g1_i1:182-1015(-)
MGQDIGKQCGCGFEADEDITEDQRLQMEQQASNSAPLASSSSGGGSAAAAAGKSRPAPDDQEGFFVPPPAPSCPAPASKPAPAPKPQAPAASTTNASASSSRPAAVPGAAASLDAILADLEAAEQTAYVAAFRGLAAGQAALQPDHEALRSFVLANSGIGPQDLDTELLKIASSNEAFAIDADSLVMLVRMNPVNDSEALEAFLRMSADGEKMSGEDCRTGLFTFLQAIGSGASADHTEKIIDAAMRDAGVTVNMEQWVGYAKTAGRIARLVSYSKI